MKVLWFEVTPPSSYIVNDTPIGGWQESLERIVKTIPEIDLFITFISDKYSEIKVINGITYLPIFTKWSFFERYFENYWDVYVRKMLPEAKRIIEQYKPDLIQIFGTEWPFGQIATFTNIPIVIHIMGAIVPYNNAEYPPGYSKEMFCKSLWNLKNRHNNWKNERSRKNREEWELKTWKLVYNYMGRTHWDSALSRVMHPGRKYYHVEEALRLPFISSGKTWELSDDNKLRLISTGCSTFWKGPDMILKVARILMAHSIDFEWYLVGKMDKTIKRVVERKEGIRFEECNCLFTGYIQPEILVDYLCRSTLYIHTAYIENSPNSICEAQCLGIPIVTTNVGGISSLVRHDVDGLLVAANDPWQMADAIIELYRDKARMKRYSVNTRELALARHKDEHIRKQLLTCYKDILNETAI